MVSTGLFVTLFVKFVSDGQGNIVVQTIVNFLLAASNITRHYWMALLLQIPLELINHADTMCYWAH